METLENNFQTEKFITRDNLNSPIAVENFYKMFVARYTCKKGFHQFHRLNHSLTFGWWKRCSEGVPFPSSKITRFAIR